MSQSKHSRLQPIGNGVIDPARVQVMRRSDGDYNVFLAGYQMVTSQADWHALVEAVWSGFVAADKHRTYLDSLLPPTLHRPNRGSVVA